MMVVAGRTSLCRSEACTKMAYLRLICCLKGNIGFYCFRFLFERQIFQLLLFDRGLFLSIRHFLMPIKHFLKDFYLKRLQVEHF